MDLPDEDFDYEKFVREEFGSSVKPAGINRVWWVTAILLIAALMAAYVYAGR